MAVERWISHSASGVLPEDFAYVEGVAQRNFVGQGPLCAQLRELLRTYYACQEVILTDSGTAALHLALIALAAGLPGRSAVLLSAYVCPQVVSAVMCAGLEPVLVDTRVESLNMDMAHARRLAGSRTLAIICSHIGGIPDDLAAASTIGIPVISDCAQGLGSRVHGHDLATAGLCAVLSFGATKMVTAGGGGALLCRDGKLAASALALASPELPVAEYRRTGFRVTYGQHPGDLMAGLACAQLHRLEAQVERRRRIAHRYNAALAEAADAKPVTEPPGVRCNRFRYYFVSSRAGRWLTALRARGIDARSSIAHAIPEYGSDLSAYPGLAGVKPQVVSLPIFPAMTDAEITAVVDALQSGPGEAE